MAPWDAGAPRFYAAHEVGPQDEGSMWVVGGWQQRDEAAKWLRTIGTGVPAWRPEAWCPRGIRRGRRSAARLRVLLHGAWRPRARSEVRCGWGKS